MSSYGRPCSPEADVEEGPPPTDSNGKKEEGSTMPATIFNLTNTVIGAGKAQMSTLIPALLFRHVMSCHGN